MNTVALEALDTPVGQILVAGTETGLSGVTFGTGAQARARLVAARTVIDEPDFTAAASRQLAEYFADGRRDFDLPLDWGLVRSRLGRDALDVLYATVPYGTTVTYGELASRVSRRRAERARTESGKGTEGGESIPARAIGSVMGANPIPIVVPCHRVLAGDGLGGYSGGSGLEVKRQLLAHEGVLPLTFDFEV